MHQPAQFIKELVRPYYLRWVYFQLVRGACPDAFRRCWQYPFVSLSAAMDGRAGFAEFFGRETVVDALFYPMTDWHTRTQRSQQLAHALAVLGSRVVYLNPHLGRQFESPAPIRREHRLSCIESGVAELHVRLPREPVFHHRLLSSAEDAIVSGAVLAVLGAMGTRDAVQVVSFPVWFGAASAVRSTRGFPIIYDCHDLIGGFANVSQKLVEAETACLRDSDLVVFSSAYLLDHHVSRMPGLKSKAVVLRNAVDAAYLRAAQRPAVLRQPVAGYIGAIEEWFDTESLEQAVARNPGCRFLLAGRLENRRVESLKRFPAVEFHGEVPYARVPELLAGFQVGLIPFVSNELTRAANPIKIYEYFSHGLPVVSARLPEVEVFGDLVYLASTPAEFAAQLQLALEEDDPVRRAARMAIAEKESWLRRAEAMLAAVRVPHC